MQIVSIDDSDIMHLAIFVNRNQKKVTSILLFFNIGKIRFDTFKLEIRQSGGFRCFNYMPSGTPRRHVIRTLAAPGAVRMSSGHQMVGLDGVGRRRGGQQS